jgi:hypothetical protein
MFPSGVLTVAFPSRIRHVSRSSYSHGNSDFSFSQIGQDSASFLSFSEGFLTLGFIFNHFACFSPLVLSYIKMNRQCFKIFSSLQWFQKGL